MTDLEARYGTTKPAQRAIALVLIVAMAGSGIGFLGWAVLHQSTPEVQSRLTYYKVVSDHNATATITVVRDSADITATCRLRAVAVDHSVVGENDLVVDSGPTTQAIDVTVRTEREATNVELIGCVTANQPRPR